MKTFEIVLTKSYKVRIKAENKYFAKEFSQIYTSDIKDISTDIEKKDLKFEIENIDCKINEIFEIEEVNENN